LHANLIASFRTRGQTFLSSRSPSHALVNPPACTEAHQGCARHGTKTCPLLSAETALFPEMLAPPAEQIVQQPRARGRLVASSLPVAPMTTRRRRGTERPGAATGVPHVRGQFLAPAPGAVTLVRWRRIRWPGGGPLGGIVQPGTTRRQTG